MLSWLTENLSTIIVSAALAAVFAGVIYSMIKNKKKGKSSCGCGCSSCPMSGSCHQK
jgi:hypothetical protein